jgi:MFS family permease
MRAGVRYLFATPEIRTPVLIASVAMFASGVGTAALYSVVDQALDRPPAFLGVLASVQGAGAIAGGLVVGRMLDRFGETAVAFIGMATFAIGPMAQALGTLPTALAGSALVGIGLPWTVVAALTAVQRHTPAGMIGCVAGSGTTLVFTPPALGIPLGALAVTLVDYRMPLALTAASCAGVAAATLRAVRRDQRRRAPSRNDCQEPSTYQPPSTDRAVPLTKPLRDESARNATA